MKKRLQRLTAFITAFVFTTSQIAWSGGTVPIDLGHTHQATREIAAHPEPSPNPSILPTDIEFLTQSSSLSAPDEEEVPAPSPVAAQEAVAQPTVDPISQYIKRNTLSLRGTKEAGTTILINGRPIEDWVQETRPILGSTTDPITPEDTVWSYFIHILDLIDHGDTETLTITARNESGEESLPVNIQVTLDQIKPSFSLSTPLTQGDTIPITGLHLEGTGGDEHFKEVVISLYYPTIGYTLYKQAASYDPLTQSWSFDIPREALIEGKPLGLSIYAYDEAGNKKGAYFPLKTQGTPDTTPPEIAITSHRDGASVSDQGFLLTGTVSDDTEVSRIHLRFFDPVTNTYLIHPTRRALGNRAHQADYDPNQGTWSFPVHKDQLTANHPITIYYSAVDTRGNASRLKSIELSIQESSPPVTPSSGFIHGTVLNAVTQEPIEGARVALVGLEGAVETEANGGFSIPTPQGGSFIATIEKEGFTSVQRQTQVESQLDIAVDTVYLTPLDPAVTRIDSSGGTHTSSTGDVVVEFPQGAVTQPVDVRATRFVAGDHLPSPLPEQSHFTYAVSFEPDGATFDAPVTYRIRNDLGFPPGTPIPVGIYREETASWEPLNMAKITQDGLWVEGEITHFSSIDCSFSATISRASVSPVIPVLDLLYSGFKDKRNSCKVPGCEIDMMDGSLREEIVIPSLSLFGEDQAVILRYDSSQAYPTVLIGTGSAIPSIIQLTPTTISASFEFQGQRVEKSFQGALDQVMMRQLFPAMNGRGEYLETGLYPYHYLPSNDYSLKYATADFFGGPPREELAVVSPELVSFTSPITGKVAVVNERDSSFGAGWTMEGLERIHLQRDGSVLLTDGTGSALPFTPAYRTQGLLPDFSHDPEAPPFAGQVLPSADSRRFAFDSQGNLFVAQASSTIVSKVTPDGTVSEFATGLNGAWSVAVDKAGYVYIGETVTAATVWKYTPDGNSRERVFAVEEFGLAGGGISDIAFDSNGDLYVALDAGCCGGFLYKRNPDGTFTELIDVNGPITGVVIDEEGNIFALESTRREGPVGGEPTTYGPPRILLRKPDGFLSTYAVGVHDPQGLVMDPDGNLLVADRALNQILKVSKDHEVEVLVKGDSLADITALGQRTPVGGSAGAFEFTDLAYDPNGDLFMLHRYFSHPPVVGFVDTVSKIVPTNKYISPPDEYSELTRNQDGTFTRRMKDGVTKNFNTDGFLTSIVDRNGNIVTYRYGPSGRLTEIEDPVGRKAVFTYTPEGKLKSIQDASGSTTTFEIDPFGDLMSVRFSDLSERHFAYDSEHRLTAQTDQRGFTTEFRYDSLGLLTEEILPERFVYDPNVGEEVLIRSHRFFQSEYGSALVNQIPPGTGTPENPAPPIPRSAVKAAYTDALGRVTTIQSDRKGDPERIEDSLGQNTVFKRYLEILWTEIDRPNGLLTRITYDDLGNMTGVINMMREGIDPNFIGNDTTFFYEPLFNQVSQIWSPGGRQTVFDYDAKGNLIKITDPQEFFGPNFTEFSYNQRGLVTKTKDTFGNTTSFSYDTLGNLTRVTDPLMNITEFTYDTRGNVTRTRDPLGRLSLFQYDPMNRLTQVTDADTETTHYTYDSSGNLTQVQDAQGRKTQYEYDALNQLLRVIHPDLTTDEFRYDEAGNLTRSVDRKGEVMKYRYDALNRLIEKRTPEGLTLYEYDSVGNLIRVEDPDSVLRFEYDPLSRLIKAETGDPDNPALSQPITTLTYEYDQASNRVKMTSPVGETLYAYQEIDPNFGQLNRGNLAQLIDPFGQVYSFQYDELGRRTSLTRPNQTQTTYQYSDRSELLSLTHTNTLTQDTIESFLYTYDDTGNRLAKTDSEGTHTYQYDDLNQLTGVSGPSPEAYQYDSVGNRTSSQLSSTYQYDPLMNRLLEDDLFTYTYDLDGNLKTKTEKTTNQVTTYTYDSENQLIRIDFPDSSFVTYRYDGLGRRIEKNVAGLMTRYIYDGEDILLEYDGTNQLTTYYTHGPGIDEPLSMARDLNQDGTFSPDEHFFYHTDALGSITSITDSTGNTIESYTYDSFGNPTVLDQSGLEIPESTMSNPYLFTGREYDSESGLYYFRRRYYDPRIGRFLSEDSLAGFVNTPSSFNLYPYLSNNPLVFSDPFGFGDVAEGVAKVLATRYGTVLTQEQIAKMSTAVERAWVIGVFDKGIFVFGTEKAKEKAVKRMFEKLNKKAAHDPEGRKLLDEFANAIEKVDPEIAALCRA